MIVFPKVIKAGIGMGVNMAKAHCLNGRQLSIIQYRAGNRLVS